MAGLLESRDVSIVCLLRSLISGVLTSDHATHFTQFSCILSCLLTRGITLYSSSYQSLPAAVGKKGSVLAHAHSRGFLN